MSRFCSLVELVFGSPSRSDEVALASRGNRPQAQLPAPAPAPALQSSGKNRGKRTAPEAADEHTEDGEVPPPISKATALLDKGKEKVSELNTYFRRSKDTSGRPSENSNTTEAKSPVLKTAIGGIMSMACVPVQKEGKTIGILAFEVANTIGKAYNLMAFLSEHGMRHLKAVVLRTRGIQQLVSADQNQLLARVGADIREQFKDFAADVARLGNVCLDPKWHNLDKKYPWLDHGRARKKCNKEKAASKMRDLMVEAKDAVALFQSIHRLKNSKKMYENELQRLTPETESTVRSLENTVIMEQEFIARMKKISIWAKRMEQIVEELVYIVHFLPSEINRFFPNFHQGGPVGEQGDLHQTLGSANLHLTYARIIVNINTLSSTTETPSRRALDSLYQALPSRIISELRPQMKLAGPVDKRTQARLRSELAWTLEWLFPMADCSQRLFQYSGLLGDWMAKGDPNAEDAIRQLKIQSLYYADRDRTEFYIKGMVMALHHLIKTAKMRFEEMSRQRRARYASVIREATTSDPSTSQAQEAITHDPPEIQEASSSASTSTSTCASPPAGFMDTVD
ncbi:hypothetical protein GUJ93_ZPchr0013g37167 [Zizania palustris]|uniref:Uncharacterized protein n=1 Tax=Zizania palustris TaxID=103762 RepID=A0A8J6C288_ZIZPA|nr:hypothetical protein GUJ93_ZPchr0013g37167 [Zizania palustris]